MTMILPNSKHAIHSTSC